MSKVAIKDHYPELFIGKQRVLVALAHPDDCEIICGGLVARLVADDHVIRLLSTTTGGKGMREKEGITEEEYTSLRLKQQISGGKLLGVREKDIYNLKHPDGEYETSVSNIGEIVFHIREFKPTIIITHNPVDFINQFDENTFWLNHRDHRHTAQNVFDAAYPYCRDVAFFPEHIQSGLKSHEVTDFLVSDLYVYPGALPFDITSYIEQKRAALAEHTCGIEPGEVDDFVEECRAEDGKYYEVLRWVRVV